jgi:hypothetical protein
MSGAIPPLPQYAFMAWWSVKKRMDNFTYALKSYWGSGSIAPRILDLGTMWR